LRDHLIDAVETGAEILCRLAPYSERGHAAGEVAMRQPSELGDGAGLVLRRPDQMRVDLDAPEPMRGPVGGNQRRGALSFRHRRLDRARARFGGAVLGLRGARQQNKRQERREVTQGIHTQNLRQNPSNGAEISHIGS